MIIVKFTTKKTTETCHLSAINLENKIHNKSIKSIRLMVVHECFQFSSTNNLKFQRKYLILFAAKEKFTDQK
jgi:hypothetical protein